LDVSGDDVQPHTVRGDKTRTAVPRCRCENSALAARRCPSDAAASGSRRAAVRLRPSLNARPETRNPRLLMYRVGIDIGGTFTDLLLVGEHGTAIIGKTLTTPGDPSVAVENALRPALENGTITTGERGTLIHGTTLVTNAP